MFKMLIFGLIISLFGCSNIPGLMTQVEVALPNSAEKKQSCNSGLEEKIRTFYSPVPDDFRDPDRDSKILEELQSCPREEIVNSIIVLQHLNPEDYEIQAKSSYLFIKLKQNENKNKKKLVALYNPTFDKFSRGFGIDRLMELICDVIINNDADKKFLSSALELAPKADGAMAQTLAATLADEFEKSPEDFLKRLKPKSKNIRQHVYLFLYATNGKQRIATSLSMIPRNPDIYPIMQEMEDFAKKASNIPS